MFQAAEMSHQISKALEAWSLQTVCDVAIFLPFVVLALVAGRAYLEELKARLSLRVVNEVWEAATDLIADGLMFLVVLVGLFVVNPDIMADIKVGLPFVPLGFVLIAAALVVRLWHGGREVGSTAWKVVLGLLVLACLVNWFGYTFVMEAAGDEYLELHPDARHWVALAGLRSNCNPDLTMQTFLWANPALMLALGWAALRGVARTGRWASSGGARRRKARDEQEG